MIPCDRCEYRKTCFPLLKLFQWISSKVCRQGRKQKVMKQATLDEAVETSEGHWETCGMPIEKPIEKEK